MPSTYSKVHSTVYTAVAPFHSPQHSPADYFNKTLIQEGLDLQTRVERDGKVTYHHVENDDDLGIVTERVFDEKRRLIRLLKRAPRGNYVETHYNPDTGAAVRASELTFTPDNLTYCKERVFHDGNRVSEVVSVHSARGALVKLIEREQVGSRTTYQGETNYDADGAPATSVNQHMSAETGELTHWEEIFWLRDGQRAMTEHVYFDAAGSTRRYVKVLHYAGAGPFSEETQDFDPQTGKITRREMIAYGPEGYHTLIDVLYYDGDGAVTERVSTFCDDFGRPLASRSLATPFEAA